MKTQKMKLINGLRSFRKVSKRLETHLLRLNLLQLKCEVFNLVWDA